MKRILCTILFSLTLSALTAQQPFTQETEIKIHEDMAKVASEPGAAKFSPPKGWKIANPKDLPPSVKLMVVGTGKREFPPSINLGTDSHRGSLKDYLKKIKAINDASGYQWKDLGIIRTEAGDASLSQVDQKTEWGDVRLMHAIIIRGENVYILTAAALKEEFPQFYKDFFYSMRSLSINPT